MVAPLLGSRRRCASWPRGTRALRRASRRASPTRSTRSRYPGVYIEEVPSGVRTITGVATSITAFVGYARAGPVNEPTIVQSFAEYARLFGGLWPKRTMSYAVQQFFQNGGRDALIVRA